MKKYNTIREGGRGEDEEIYQVKEKVNDMLREK